MVGSHHSNPFALFASVYMVYNIVAFVIIVGCLVFLIVLIVRKSPQVALIDVEHIPEERTEKKKREIMESRLRRRTKDFLEKLSKFFKPFFSFLQNILGRATDRLHKIEEYSKQRKRDLVRQDKNKSVERIKELLTRGEEMIAKGDYEPAEQVFIEVVSLDSRNVEAYEHLAEIYTALRQYDHAREVWVYVERLTGRDEKVLTNIGVLHAAEGKHEAAYDDFREALSFSPRNPRLLDLFLEECILSGKKKEAQDALEMLCSVNPENQKLADLEKRIQQL